MSRLTALAVVHVILLAAIVAYALVGHSSLPETWAAHYDLQGEPDRWAEKESWEFCILPGIAVFTGLLLLATVKLPPALVNFPQKKTVLGWPEDHRTPVYDRLRELILVVAVITDVEFLVILHVIVRSARGGLSLSALAILVPMAALFIAIAVYMAQVSRLVKRTEAELTTGGAPSTTRPR